MTPTDARESIAEFIRSTTCCPSAPGTAALTLLSIPVSTSGRRDSMNPPTLKPTISKGNNAKIV